MDSVTPHPEIFQPLLQDSPIAMLMIDPLGNIVFFNRGAEDLFRMDAPDALRRPIHELIPKRFWAIHRINVQSYFQDPVERPAEALGAIWAVRRDRSEVLVTIALSPVLTANETYSAAWIVPVKDQVKEAPMESNREQEDAFGSD